LKNRILLYVNKEGTVQGHKNTKLVMESSRPKKAAEKIQLYSSANLLKKAIGGEKTTATYFFNVRYCCLQLPNTWTDSWQWELPWNLK
jgi:hypothetical protein